MLQRMVCVKWFVLVLTSSCNTHYRKPKPKPEKKKNETKAENATNTTEEEIHVEPDNSTIPEDTKEEGETTETTEDDAKPGAEL